MLEIISYRDITHISPDKAAGDSIFQNKFLQTFTEMMSHFILLALLLHSMNGILFLFLLLVVGTYVYPTVSYLLMYLFPLPTAFGFLPFMHEWSEICSLTSH